MTGPEVRQIGPGCAVRGFRGGPPPSATELAGAICTYLLFVRWLLEPHSAWHRGRDQC
jgi:hypothetical protein